MAGRSDKIIDSVDRYFTCHASRIIMLFLLFLSKSVLVKAEQDSALVSTVVIKGSRKS